MHLVGIIALTHVHTTTMTMDYDYQIPDVLFTTYNNSAILHATIGFRTCS
ncbi:MAG: hypothetical protein RL076_1285 [Chloroflexota bacterium]